MNKPLAAHKRYVAHFDMLGFKKATVRNPDRAWRALGKLRLCMDQLPNYKLAHVAQDRTIPNRLQTRIFSDSILVFSVSDQIDDLTGMLLLTSQLFADVLTFCLPLRGGISYGDFFVDDDLQLYCGIPFVKAYELGEQSQWCGIVLDEVVAERFNEQPDGPLTTHDNIPTIVQWDVPVKVEGKVGKKKSWVVNWPVIFREGFTKRRPLSIQEYYQAFEVLLGPYEGLPRDAKDKHKNTVDFINAQLR